MTKRTGKDGAGLNEQATRFTVANQPLNNGHRNRLRERFASAPEALPDYELLELLLFRSIPRADTKPLAKALLQRFRTFAGVLGTSERLIAEVPGAGPTVARDLKIVAEAAKRMAKSVVVERVILDAWSKVIEYCTIAMAHEDREQFRILFLDKKNKLIADEVQQRGTVDHTPVYPREVVRRALELSSTAVILVHNHPSGDATPSRADIEMTKQLVDAAKPLGIQILDHIIIGKDGSVTMRGLKLM